MKKVKQICRMTIGRIHAPHQKIVTHYKTLNKFSKTIFKNTKYYDAAFKSWTVVPVGQERTVYHRAILEERNVDKKGLLNLLPENKVEEGNNKGDFAFADKSTFVHLLNIPKQDIDFCKFSLSEVETVCTEAIDEFEVFYVKNQFKNMKKARHVKEIELMDNARQTVLRITKELRVLALDDVLRKLRRSLLGTSPTLLLQTTH